MAHEAYDEHWSSCATVLHMRKERDSEQCPRCEEFETHLHIIQCKGEGTDEVF